MKELATTTVIDVIDGKNVIKSVLIHTQTSCLLVDKALIKINGENADRVAKVILAMFAAIQRAEQFISGFEDDETQTGVDDILEMLRQFDL